MTVPAQVECGADAALLQQEQRFLEMVPELRREYMGQFVAVKDGRVVAHGPDDEELVARLQDRGGAEGIYIGWVGDVSPVYDLPSPNEVR